VEEIRSIIDDPSNGMTLESNAHFGLDDFRWSLRAVEGHLSCEGTWTHTTAQRRDYFRGF